MPKKSTTLKPRAIFPKPVSTTIDAERVNPAHIVLKFKEGTHIRLRSGVLVYDPKQIKSGERLRLEQVGLSDAQIQSDLKQINKVLQGNPLLSCSRLFFSQDEAKLALDKARGEAKSRHELADLDLYYNLTFDKLDIPRAEKLAKQLNRLPSVEIAYPQPIPHLPDEYIPPTTNITPPLSQGYLNGAPNGIDARYAWIFPGGRGANVKLVDVEFGWNLNHEDLPSKYFYGNGVNPNDDLIRAIIDLETAITTAFVGPVVLGGHPFPPLTGLVKPVSHGTAVLGVLVARDNGFGATGIVPDIALGWSSVVPSVLLLSPLLYPGSIPGGIVFQAAWAIYNAASELGPGDVLLVEQHYPQANLAWPNALNGRQDGYVPVEYYAAEFDAIKIVTALGIIVVEAAGNGQVDLDELERMGWFNLQDSGAILVGAGTSGLPSSESPGSPRSPCRFTNYGHRVDVQGWGEKVETLGYGGPPHGPADPTLRLNDGDARQWYTRDFGGTSSAAPIVAGAVCAIQGIRIAHGDQKFGPADMRDLLRNTGTPQAPNAKHIGPLPDLYKAINDYLRIPLPDGVLLTNSGATTVWVVYGEARFLVPDAVLNALFAGVPRHQLSNETLAKIPKVPIDGTLLRETNGAVWVVYGGAKFHVPDVPALNDLFPGVPVHQLLWDGALDSIPSAPADGTLLTDTHDIYVIYGGAKFPVPGALRSEFFPDVPVGEVWDGALDGIPSIPVDGTLLADPHDIWVIYGGAKFLAPGNWLIGTSFKNRPVHQLWDGALSGIPAIPIDGTLLNVTGEDIWVVYGGAKFRFADRQDLQRLFSGAPVHEVWGSALSGIPGIPVNGTLLRETNGAIWVIYGGAKFHVPDTATLRKFFPRVPVHQLWDGALAGIPDIPVGGTLLQANDPPPSLSDFTGRPAIQPPRTGLRQAPDVPVWVVYGGAKFHVPDTATLRKFFPRVPVHRLWNGALAGIPDIPVDGTLLQANDPPPSLSDFTGRPAIQPPRTGLRQAPDVPVWVVYGGAKFHVPDDGTRLRLYPGVPVNHMWDGALANTLILPRDGTLLKEDSNPSTYVMDNKKKCLIASDSAFWRYDTSKIRVVPDGALAFIPTGPPVQ